MKKYIIVSIIVCISISLLKAQEENGKFKSMGSGGFTIGYGYMDVSKIHAFVPKEIADFNNNHMLIGGTGHGMLNDFIVGGTGLAIGGDLIMADNYKITNGGGVGTIDFGYQILDKEQVKIYPMIGIGGCMYGLQVSRNKNVPINTIVNDPGQEINVSLGGFVMDFSLNLNYIPLVLYDDIDNSYGGFMTGFKVGYLLSVPSSDWIYSGGNVIGGPSFGLNMWYAKLIIGGFGYSKGNK